MPTASVGHGTLSIKRFLATPPTIAAAYLFSWLDAIIDATDLPYSTDKTV